MGKKNQKSLFFSEVISCHLFDKYLKMILLPGVARPLKFKRLNLAMGGFEKVKILKKAK
jgi:hypothetical protein